jgi:hypothetical protein
MPLYETPVGRVLFIHVPNAGGSPIRSHLRSAFHESWGSDRRLPDVLVSPQNYHGELLASLPKPTYAFILIRHPADRLIAEWERQSREPGRFYRGLSYSWWLRYSLAEATRDHHYWDNHFRPQAEFEAFDAEVFKLENGLSPVFRRLEEVTGLAPPTSVGNEENDGRKVEIKHEDLIRQANFYRDDFRQFGYRW